MLSNLGLPAQLLIAILCYTQKPHVLKSIRFICIAPFDNTQLQNRVEYYVITVIENN